MRQGKDVMSDGHDKLMYLLPLRKGNVFTSVCHSSCPQEGGLPRAGGGSASRVSLHPGGVCLGESAYRGVCIQRGVGQTPSPIRYYGIQSTSGRYTSYWNAFLFLR